MLSVSGSFFHPSKYTVTKDVYSARVQRALLQNSKRAKSYTDTPIIHISIKKKLQRGQPQYSGFIISPNKNWLLLSHYLFLGNILQLIKKSAQTKTINRHLKYCLRKVLFVKSHYQIPIAMLPLETAQISVLVRHTDI